MRIAIVDDEVHCIESLVIHLTELFPEMTVVYKGNKAQKAIEKLKELPIDLLFLDIEMPRMNGFQLLEHIPERDFDVIFTTAYSQYALQAFKARAINYLLKPIDEEELKEVVSIWKGNRKKQNADNIESLLDHLRKEGILKSKISIPISNGHEFVEVNHILYCKSRSNYTTLFLKNGEKILVSRTMKEVEKTLDRFFFIRIHQSYLINPNFMKKFYRNDGGYIEMQDGKKIPVSRSRRKLLTSLFDAISKEIE